MASQEQWKETHAAKDKYCSALLQNPHVNYVGVSVKIVAGQYMDTPTIVVAVKKKFSLAELKLKGEEGIAPTLDGVPTDVIEDDLNLVKLDLRDTEKEPIAQDLVGPMDPFAYDETMISGQSMAKYSTPSAYGTVGCFVKVLTSRPQFPGITAGNDYLITCQHNVEGLKTGDDAIVPARKQSGKPPDKYVRTKYADGIDDPDTANADIAALAPKSGTKYANQIPTSSTYIPFTRVLDDWPTPLDKVFKYGATTWYTEGYVKAVNVSSGGYDRIMTVNGKKSGSRDTVFCDTGDSGSAVVLLQDQGQITGQIFAVNDTTYQPGKGYTQSYVYRMDLQLSTLAASWQLS